MTPASILFRNARIFDGHSPDYLEPADVFVQNGLIAEVSAKEIRRSVELIIDLQRRVLMPGLIDNHVHVYATEVDLSVTARQRATYIAHFGSFSLRRSLDYGFTTVRDVAGADAGLAQAVDQALFPSPRLFYGGAAISQTGGHGDFRRPWEDDQPPCGCVFHGAGDSRLVTIADGADAVRRAAREELRKGARHIKIFGSGGVASPSDPLESVQFSTEEIRVAVEEAARHGAYVTAHCYGAEAVRRAVEHGVRCIEHGTLIDEGTAAFLAQRGAYVVPTLVVLFALAEEGERLGFPAVSMAKLRTVHAKALSSLELMMRAGIKLGLGTDLLGKLQARQCEEFRIRREVQSPFQILQSATSINAEILMQAGKLGCVAPGAHADLLVVDGDPLSDIAVLTQNGQKLPVIMKAGRFHKKLI
ncbi:MAG TPA: amidohydrolase family protein [Candidatus Acidoferrales bacterium]|nr:amidohydrolase family protein [Candidatus Acidoferrales bacterium]